MAGRFIAPSEQYFDNSGNILAGGKLFFYDSGTVVAKDTFSDPGGTIPNSNPVILDGAGRTPDIYLTGSYKLIIKDSADAQIETRDPVLAADDTTKGFAVWNAVTVFSELDIVRAANNFLYRSLADSNQNFEPSASAAKWSQVQLLGSYNANETYATGNTVVDSTGNIYKSRVDSNTGNTPASSPTQWATSIPAIFDTLTANTINETTSGSGVTIDGVLVKDGGVNGSLGATTPSTIAGTTLDITGAFTTGTAAWAIGTNQLVKNAAGNFGIGVTPAGWLASYTALDIAGGASLSAHIGTNADLSANIYVDVGGDWTAKTTAAGSLYRQNLGVHAWYNSASVTADTTVTLVNTMTLDASGNLTLNTARVGVGQSSIGFNGFTAQGLNLQTTYASTGSTYLGFYTSAGTVIGSISQSGAATTSFNTTSDPRLKSEFTEITGALDLIVEAHDNSYIGEFEFLSDAGNKVWGYNAHALIDNQAGLGGCEGRGPRNVELNHVDITPAGVDQSKRVPMLEAAIYDLLKMNEALTARLDAAGI